MIYIDSSVAIAHLFAEERRPNAELWNETLVSSRLLEYEVFSSLNARKLSSSHVEVARQLLSGVALLEIIPEIVDRALDGYPIPVRTLDGLHLASIEFLREQRQEVQLASYDSRLIKAAQRMGINVLALA